jgi:hypothetical protein
MHYGILDIRVERTFFRRGGVYIIVNRPYRPSEAFISPPKSLYIANHLLSSVKRFFIFFTERNFETNYTEKASSQIEPPEGDRISPPSPFAPLVPITFSVLTNSMEYHQHPLALFSPLFFIALPLFIG